MRKENDIRRGDIFLADLGEGNGSVQGGLRPVLILEAENISKNSPTVIAAAITSRIKKEYMPSHVILPDIEGLDKTSMTLLEQIMTLNKKDLGKYLGSLEDEKTWRIINNGIKKVFGLWFYKSFENANVRCLCRACAKDYMDAGYIVKRLDPFKKTKEGCTKCDSRGYDYIVYDPRKAR